MFQNAIFDRFLDPSCSEEDLGEIRSWLSFRVCPRCLTEDIQICISNDFDDEDYLVGETASCYCCRPSCLETAFISRNFD